VGEAVNVTSLLDDCDALVRDELICMPDVEDVEDFDPADEAPPITARRWLRVTDAVAVVADLKSSTKLGLNKNARSTASIYEAALRPVVDIFCEFGAGWIPIQGDCVIGIFWDDRAIERAICAGITAKTFSERHLVDRLVRKWPELPATGFKVGVATSTLLVKRIGRPRSPHQAIVWPGKAVNYAVKAAQSGDAGELIVTGSMWDSIADNDFLTFTCDCATPSPQLWHDHDLEQLDHDDAERAGRCLTSAWCPTCGDDFCSRILEGEKRRSSVDAYRSQLQMSLFQGALAKKFAAERAASRNLRRLRTGR
jgi:class 3 adenylate cyclase